jgi:hypothetical protein
MKPLLTLALIVSILIEITITFADAKLVE